jgi:hypothetical protein
VDSAGDKEELNCCFKTKSRMDFGGFTNKIKASAEAAAVAARSFKGFDDMAAQDEYIHSDTLNVKRERRPTQSKSWEQPPSSQREREEGDSYSQTGTDTELGVSSGRSSESSWSLLDRPRHDATPKSEEENAAAATASRQSHPWHSAQITSSIHSLPETGSNSEKTKQKAPQRQSTMPLLDVVADTLSSSKTSSGAREKQTTRDESMSNRASNNREDDSSSADSSENGFSDDDENDPILSMIRKTSPLSLSRRGSGKEKPKNPIQKPTQKMQFLEMEDSSPVPRQKQNIKKNPNRFMQDLDQRMAMPKLDHDDDDDDDNMEAGLLSSSSAKAAPAEPSAWLWGMLNGGGRQQESSAAVTERKAAFSRQDRQTQVKPVEESYNVVGSSSVLGEDEIRALAQMKESSTRQGVGAACLDRVRRHKREGFIVFTLLLGWAVYFYSRKISVENDVHT